MATGSPAAIPAPPLDASAPPRPTLALLFALSLLLYATVSLVLRSSPNADYPSLHSALDAGSAVVASVIALSLRTRGPARDIRLSGLVGICFTVTAALELLHTLVGAEWTGLATTLLRPATWPPTAYVPSLALAWIFALQARGRNLRPALLWIGLGLGSLAALALFMALPRYTPPTWLGVTRPTLVGVPLLWAYVAVGAWRSRHSDRLAYGVLPCSLLLCVAGLVMAYSRAPHDPAAMAAHVGKLLGYLNLQLFIARAGALDSDELRRTAQALRAAEAYARSIVDSAYDAFIAIDRTGTVIGWNRQAELALGWSREEAIGRSLAELCIPLRFREAHSRGLAHYLTTGEGPVLNRVLELAAVRRDGSEFPIELTIAPVQFRGESIFAAFLRDITSRKQSEATVAQYAAELEVSNKELDAFAYSVSHDLRAPLRSIDGFSQALLEDHSAALDADGQDALRRVRAASQRMAALIDDLLALSQVTRTTMRRGPVNLSELVRYVAEDLRRGDPSREVEFEIAPDVVAQGDAALLRIALENLLGNAWKYTAKHPRARIEFGTEPHNGKPAYYIRDDGAGFDMTYADKLFGAFQRLHTRSEFEGSGIGLATVQRIIHRHGGRIWAEGAVERGAAFYFVL